MSFHLKKLARFMYDLHSPEPRSTTTQQQRCCRLTFQRAQPLSGPGIKTAATKEKTFDLSVKFLPFEALMRESSHR